MDQPGGFGRHHDASIASIVDNARTHLEVVCIAHSNRSPEATESVQAESPSQKALSRPPIDCKATA